MIHKTKGASNEITVSPIKKMSSDQTIQHLQLDKNFSPQNAPIYAKNSSEENEVPTTSSTWNVKKIVKKLKKGIANLPKNSQPIADTSFISQFLNFLVDEVHCREMNETASTDYFSKKLLKKVLKEVRNLQTDETYFQNNTFSLKVLKMVSQEITILSSGIFYGEDLGTFEIDDDFDEEEFEKELKNLSKKTKNEKLKRLANIPKKKKEMKTKVKNTKLRMTDSPASFKNTKSPYSKSQSTPTPRIKEVTSDTPIASTNSGYQMLMSMGWDGGGLGKNRDGISDPIKVKVKPNAHGIGFDKHPKRKLKTDKQ